MVLEAFNLYRPFNIDLYYTTSYELYSIGTQSKPTFIDIH